MMFCWPVAEMVLVMFERILSCIDVKLPLIDHEKFFRSMAWSVACNSSPALFTLPRLMS